MARFAVLASRSPDLLRRVEVAVTTLHPRDPLTRLQGRAVLLSELRLLTEPAVLVMADLDGLREVNAERGVRVGDQVLRDAATKLQELVAPSRVYRTGDDEFAWLLQPLPTDATSYAERVLAGWQVNAVEVSACVGWVQAAPGDGSERALGQVGAAVAAAKSSPSKVAGFTDLDAAALSRRHAVGHALADALRATTGQLHLVFQPIRRLQDGALVAVETLARWEHPTLGVVTPDEFVTLAEQTGQSCDLDRWVMAQAVTQARHLPGQPVVHVNVSAASLTTPGFTDELLDLIGQSGTDPGLLCVELTETALASNSTRLRHAVNTLHAEGILISIDDFGTGHASWSYLSELHVDELKLDKSYVQGLPDDPYRLAVARAILEVAQACGQTVVAEGVETPEQARALLALGCQLGQGYLLGRAERHLGPTGPVLATTPHGPRPAGHPTGAVAGDTDTAQQLTDLARALSISPGDPASVFRLTLSVLRRSIDFDGGSLQLVGPDGVRLAAADPQPPAEAFQARLPVGQGVAGTVLSTGRPVYLTDITSSPAVPTRRRAISGGVRSYLAVPLFRRGKAIGVLQIDSTHLDAFDSEDRLQLAAAAPLVAAALRQRTRMAVVPAPLPVVAGAPKARLPHP